MTLALIPMDRLKAKSVIALTVLTGLMKSRRKLKLIWMSKLLNLRGRGRRRLVTGCFFSLSLGFEA